MLGRTMKRYLRLKRIDWELTHICSKDKILDVGCGLGIDAILLSKNVDFYIGIDIDKKSLLIAKKLVRMQGSVNTDFVLASAFNLPFRDNIFDVCVSYSSIEHSKTNFLDWIREMSRVTRSGGYITITTSNKLSLLIYLQSKLKEKLHPDYQEYFFSEKELRKMFNTAGLNVIKKGATGLYYHTYPITPFSIVNEAIEDAAFFLERNLKLFRMFGGRIGFLCRKTCDEKISTHEQA
jgi:ubiquinone/menaquinone biosynthesis C-methylase UbiE